MVLSAGVWPGTPAGAARFGSVTKWLSLTVLADRNDYPRHALNSTLRTQRFMLKDVQTPFDVAVVFQTLLRPSLVRAVRSVFRQDLKGRIQILIGIDKHQCDSSVLDELQRECPDNFFLTVIDLGYSTNLRYGGLYSGYGGCLRTLLSYAANSKLVAYLDDDDWWAHNHLSSLVSAVAGKVWAFSYRWMVDQETAWPICRDEWDSLGPNRGINKDRFGGFVAPSNLIIDKDSCHFILPLWALAAFADGTGQDRMIFDALLKKHPWAATGKYTSYYELRRDHQQHAHHAREFAARNINWLRDRNLVDTIARLAEEAAIHLENREFEAAVSLCLRALTLNPHHARTLSRLATAQYRRGRVTDAMTHIIHAREVDDHDPAVAEAWSEIGTAATARTTALRSGSFADACVANAAPHVSVVASF
jgi:hypothetical protein